MKNILNALELLPFEYHTYFEASDSTLKQVTVVVVFKSKSLSNLLEIIFETLAKLKIDKLFRDSLP